MYYLDAFGTVWLPYKTLYKTGRSGAKVRAMKSCRNFSQQTHPIHPIGPLPHVSVCFVLFGCIWDSLLRYNTQFMPRSRVGIFRNERTRSTPLDSKLMFLCVLYYLDAFGLFGCLTKLNAKQAELVQKFVPRSRVLSFRIKHTQLSPLGPKLIYLRVSYYLGTFGTVWLPYKTRWKRAEVVQKFVPRSRVRIFCNEHTHPTH